MSTLSTAAKLAMYLASRPAGRPFSWGDNNCCHFAAGWIMHVTGWSPLEGLPPIATAHDAMTQLRALGGGLCHAWTIRLGVPRVAAEAADVGDIVMFDQQHPGLAGGVGALVGICAGSGVVACLTQDGDAIYLPQADAQCAWLLSDVVQRHGVAP